MTIFPFTKRRDYRTRFFSCLSDVPIFCKVLWCPCITSGLLVGNMEGRTFNPISCIFCCAGIYRARRIVQTLHQQKESENVSMQAAHCCPCCALMQDYREWNLTVNDQPPSPVDLPTTKELP